MRPARAGGESTLASAVAIHNEIMRGRPDLLRVLYEPYWVDRRDEIPEGLQPYYPMPVFHYHGGRLTVNYERLHIESSQRLGRYRWVVERTHSWLNRYRRLKVRYERRQDIHQAFLSLGCALICLNYLQH